MKLDVSKKIEGIMQSNALDDLSLKFLPPVSDSPDNYYFISYSHKDYKAVYSDIYALQSEGVNVWYDRAMPAGASWKETAEKYIRPSRCAGVVFYVSENSLLSPAIHEEIAFAKQCGKSCLTINLPTSDGKSHSAKEMLDAIQSNGVEISVDKYEFIAQSFNEEVLYVPYSASAEQKADKILHLQKPPILKIEERESSGEGKVVAVNDIEIKELNESDFAFVGSNGEINYASSIGACAFANCKNLQSVRLPSTVSYISRYAFYGCSSLKYINLDNVDYICEYGFAECESLSSVVLSKKMTCISDGLFYNSGLTEIVIPPKVTEIRREAFAFCKLQSIKIPKSVEEIAVEAFACCQLESIAIPDNVKQVGWHAFVSCLNLKKLSIGNGLTTFDFSPFDNCPNVEEIRLGKNIKNINLLDSEYGFDIFRELKSIKVDKANETYASVNNCFIDIAKKELLYITPNASIPTDGSVASISEEVIRHGSDFKNNTLFIPKCIESLNFPIWCWKRYDKIIVEPGHPKYHSAGNCLIETATRRLILGCKGSVIPTDGSVTIIGDGAFSGKSEVGYIEIPPCIEEIEANAFHMSDIYQIRFYCENLKRIGGYAFYDCHLKWVDIDDLNLWCKIDFDDNYSTPISGAKLYVDEELADRIIITDETTPINEFAFGKYRALRKLIVLKLESGVSLKAFKDCTRIEEILLPEGMIVTDIEELPARLVDKIKCKSYIDLIAEVF